MNDRNTPDSSDLQRREDALRVAFYWAASDGDTEMVRVLIDAGAKEEWWRSALLRASENGRTETTTFLLEAVDSEFTARSAFRAAAAKEHIDTVKVIADWIGQQQKSSAGTTITPVPPS